MKWRKGTKPRKPGRPRMLADIEQLILRIAREMGWGYTSILGDLKKLGINTVSRSTVVNILKRAGFDPCPERARGRQSVTPVSLQICSPNMNAHAERFIQTLQKECLDHFVACGTKHLDYLVRELVKHYHTERPHQGLENRAPLDTGPPNDDHFGTIRCSSRLGGGLKH